MGVAVQVLLLNKGPIVHYRRFFRWAYWTGFVATVIFFGCYAWYSWQAYERDNLNLLQLDSNMVAQTTRNLLDGQLFVLQILDRQLQGLHSFHDQKDIRTILSNYLLGAGDSINILIVRKNGRILDSVRHLDEKEILDGFRDPVLWRKVAKDPGVAISRPFRSSLTRQQWVIGVSRSISVTTKKLLYLVELMKFSRLEGSLKRIPLGQGIAMGLVFNNASIEGRWPIPHGNLRKLIMHYPIRGALIRVLRHDPTHNEGVYKGLVTIDHVARIGAFDRLAGYPLTAFVSIHKATLIHAWWVHHAQFPFVFLIFVLGFSFFAYHRILNLDQQWSVERQHFEEALKSQATHDSLTGLPNREGLDLILHRAMARSNRQDLLLVVGFLDLDDFKPINDQYGHAVGDDLLQEFADRMRNTLRQTDVAVRLGGDEFVLLFEGIHHLGELEEILFRLQKEINRPFLIHGETLLVRASLGLTIYPFDDSDPEILIRHADKAMYVAKARLKTHSLHWIAYYALDNHRLIDG